MTECAAYSTRDDPLQFCSVAAEYDSIDETQLTKATLTPHDEHTNHSKATFKAIISYSI